MLLAGSFDVNKVDPGGFVGEVFVVEGVAVGMEKLSRLLEESKMGIIAHRTRVVNGDKGSPFGRLVLMSNKVMLVVIGVLGGMSSLR